MWKREFYTEEKCISEAKEYKSKRYDKTHKEPDFREGDQVLVSTLNFNNIKCPNKMRQQFSEPFSIIRLGGKNAVEVRLTGNSPGNTQCSQWAWLNCPTRPERIGSPPGT
ncbi:hypothetical protein O181_031484 [Austropuccinia psidii MF-1]|uniref:Uncharacterized protein n=1 Tax=Austropuccinia psidii MF-1 TaxID=1389203 RepID=A0A9Q3H6L2_9BASI|nr:hypothetical protein [Austropuccinia psidii MF-1]